MKHLTHKPVDQVDQAVTLEEWHRANDGGGHTARTVRPHHHTFEPLV